MGSGAGGGSSPCRSSLPRSDGTSAWSRSFKLRTMDSRCICRGMAISNTSNHEINRDKSDEPQASDGDPVELESHPEANADAGHFDGSPTEFPDQCRLDSLWLAGGSHEVASNPINILQQIASRRSSRCPGADQAPVGRSLPGRTVRAKYGRERKNPWPPQGATLLSPSSSTSRLLFSCRRDLGLGSR